MGRAVMTRHLPPDQTSCPFVDVSKLSFHLLFSHFRIITRASSKEHSIIPASSEVGVLTRLSQGGLLFRFQVGLNVLGSTVKAHRLQSAGFARLKTEAINFSICGVVFKMFIYFYCLAIIVSIPIDDRRSFGNLLTYRSAQTV
jgi:hypothetical protein